jgi:hypothetical protein
MPTKKTEIPANLVQVLAPKKTGRPSSGVPRSEAFKVASKASRKNKIDSGKAELKCFVDPQTKEWLASLKAAFGVSSVGEVLDMLAEKETQKDK